MIPRSALIELSQGVPSSKYATASCLNPKYRRVRMSEDGSYQDIYCNCGKCLKCTDAKRNEMATRMFLHATHYDYCYFITLTYGSYNLLPFKRHPFLADWLQTIPTYDKNNSFHSPRWTPSILVKSHLQKFLKRLRKSVGSFTYCACGEYGEDYGRPHFHCILFSNIPISKDAIEDAWSLECKRTNSKYVVRPWRCDLPKTSENGYFKFRIGAIQYADLYANGSLNYDGRHPGLYSGGENALHNFTYVAKYLGKSTVDSIANLPSWVYTRMRYAWCCYTDDIDKLADICPTPSDWQLNIKSLINLSYDNYEFQKISFNDFKKLVSPFFLSSRRPAIGKQYFLENCARFQAKGFTLPKFMGKSVAFPSYYFRLLSQKNYPIRLRKSVPSGISPTKDLLPRVYSYFSALREDASFWYTIRGLVVPTQTFVSRHDLFDRGIYLYSITGNPADGEVDHIDFVDPFNKVIHFVYDPQYELFRGYVYNVHTKSYDLYEHYYDREEFCDLILSEIEDEYKNYPDKLFNMQTSFDVQNAVLSDCESLSVRELYIKHRLEKQQLYKCKHKTAL